MSSEPPRNSYLDQVVAQQARLEVDLKAKQGPKRVDAQAAAANLRAAVQASK